MTALKLADPNLFDVAYICHHMRAEDAREIFAMRFDDDRDRLAIDVIQKWSIAWVIGLEKPIAVLGAVEVWPGMWSVGMFATDDFPKVGRQLTRWCKRRMIPALQELGMRRAEARTIEGHDTAHRWMERLGATLEGGPMKKYGKGGETFFTYVWEF